MLAHSWIILLLLLHHCWLLAGESSYKLQPDYDYVANDGTARWWRPRLRLARANSGAAEPGSASGEEGQQSSLGLTASSIHEVITAMSTERVQPAPSTTSARGHGSPSPTPSASPAVSLPSMSSFSSSFSFSSSSSAFPLLTTTALATPLPLPYNTTVSITFEPDTAIPSGLQIDSIAEEILNQTVSYFKETLGFSEHQITSAKVTVENNTESIGRGQRQATVGTVVIVQVTVTELGQAKEKQLVAEVESRNFTVETSSGLNFSATHVTFSTPLQTSLVSNTLPSTTTETVTTMSTLATPTLSLLATPTSSPLSGTDYDLMQLFWIIVGSGGGCIIVLLACVVMVICMWCGLCARKKKRNLIYTLDGFECQDYPTWQNAYYPAPNTPGSAPRPLSYTIDNRMATSTFNIVHEL